MTVLGMLAGWLAGALLLSPLPVFAGLPPPANWIVNVVPLFVGVVLLVVLVALLYLLVSLTTANGQPSTTNGFSDLCLGGLIGVNAGANFMLSFTVVALLFWPVGLAVGMLVAPAISLVNALAAVPPLARAPWFAAVLGWFSWAMPMSWPMTVTGLVFLAINGLAFVAGVPLRLGFEWWTGTVIVHGGVTHVSRAGFNTGNLSFFHPQFGNAAPWLNTGLTPPVINSGTVQGMTFHETGHTLNVAACGFIFHLIGAIDQNALTGAFAYSEQLAEGHLHDASAPWIDWWRPQIAAIGGAVPNAASSSPNPNLVEPIGVVPVGTTITFNRADPAIVPSPPTDADNYPQGVVNPGVIPPVGFLWTLTQQPPGSTATIAPPNAAVATFTPDIGGDYVVSLDHSDGVNGTPVLLTPTGPLSPAAGFPAFVASPLLSTNVINVVEARTVAQLETPVNVPVQLSSTGSTAGSQGVSLDWVITEQVPGSTASVNPPTFDPSPFFVADRAGEYVVTLTVTGPNNVTHSSTTRVIVT